MGSLTTTTNRLLIIDDETSMGTLIARVATQCGFETIHAANAQLGLELMASWKPTLLILDLQMPSTDGIEVLRHLASARCDARIILASGHGSQVLNTAQRLGRERGLTIETTLLKPFDVPDLRALLQRLKSDDGWLTENVLEAAIAEGQLVLHYQPKIEIRTNAVVGFEALVRWMHPERGLVAPDEFIGFAESAGKMDKLTEWVINAALAQLAEWSHHGLSVAVNVSVANLRNLEFADHLDLLCKIHGIAARRLCIEITETDAMSDEISAMDILARLRLKGYPVSIDDFGTGHSSLIRLLRMPISEIKIDQSFVRESHASQENFVIVRAIVDLAHNLGMTAIAEGVENEKILGVLAAIGCDAAQGFHISRPLPAEDVIPWHKGWIEGLAPVEA